MSSIEASLLFRSATETDVPRLVAMLADDALGAQREDASDPLPATYSDAFRAIDADPNNRLLVAERDREVVGFLQLTLIPYLTYRGRWRGLIESVRVCSTHRGQGVGAQLFRHAIEICRREGCHLVQLTTDKQRPDALRFYSQLGFVASHEGMKLHFD